MVGLGQFENVKSGSDEVALTPFSTLTGPTRGMRRDKRRPDPAKAELPSLPRKPLIFIDNAHIAPCRLFLAKRSLDSLPKSREGVRLHNFALCGGGIR